MGMTPRTGDLWAEASERHLVAQRRVSDVAGGFGAMAKVLRLTLQSLVLGVGAYLVIEGEATGGIMIASSILVARALAPVELAVAHWKSLVAARQGWGRLKAFLAAFPNERLSVALSAPCESVRVEALTVTAPGLEHALVDDATFALRAGEGLGVIGASGSGKSSLIRALVGIWGPVRGCVRLDGATLDRWPPDGRRACTGGLQPCRLPASVSAWLCRSSVGQISRRRPGPSRPWRSSEPSYSRLLRAWRRATLGSTSSPCSRWAARSRCRSRWPAPSSP